MTKGKNVNVGIGDIKTPPTEKLIVEGKAFTEKQVTALLQKQIAECASAIDADNISQYTAKKKIYEVKLVEIK